MDARELNAESFFTEFRNKIAPNNLYSFGGENLSNSAYTQNIKIKIKEIAEYFGMSDWHEYYHVDHVLGLDCKQSEAIEAEKHKFIPHGWTINALIEHENNPWDWNEEVIKLAPFHCALRIVIAYCSIEEDEMKLEYAAQLLRKTRDADCFSDSGVFMIILGNRGKKNADFRGYILNKYSFIFEKKFS